MSKEVIELVERRHVRPAELREAVAAPEGALAGRVELEWTSIERIGPDMRIVARVCRAARPDVVVR